MAAGMFPENRTWQVMLECYIHFLFCIFVMSGRSFEPRRNSEASDAQNLSAFSLPAGRHSLKAEIFQRRVPSFVPNALECLAGCHVFL